MNELNPLVSIILPVYNGEKHLNEAILSIISQDYENFELIIVNDGSTDKSPEIIDSFAKSDSRIKRVDNPHNMGLIKTLNRGLKLCKGEFIARQDADDISLSGRFSKQIDFFNKHPEVGIVGSAMESMDESGNKIEIYRQPETDCEIRFRTLFNCPFVHTSVMLRKNVILDHNLFYDENFKHAEDYELWTRVLKITKAYNFQSPLVKYRVSGTSISQVHAKDQKNTAHLVSRSQLVKYGEEFDFTWDAKCLMLDIFRKYLWGEPLNFTDNDLKIMGDLSSLLAKFIKMENCNEQRLVLFAGIIKVHFNNIPLLKRISLRTKDIIKRLGASSD